MKGDGVRQMPRLAGLDGDRRNGKKLGRGIRRDVLEIGLICSPIEGWIGNMPDWRKQ